MYLVLSTFVETIAHTLVFRDTFAFVEHRCFSRTCADDVTALTGSAVGDDRAAGASTVSPFVAQCCVHVGWTN